MHFDKNYILFSIPLYTFVLFYFYLLLELFVCILFLKIIIVLHKIYYIQLIDLVNLKIIHNYL